jgi:glucose-6-phosphate isomerase
MAGYCRMTAMPSARAALPAWQKLSEHQRATSTLHLRDLFARDPARFRKFSLACCGLLVDWSKQLVTDDTPRLLGALARECELESWVKRMFAGERVNSSENRAALHVALRADTPIALDGRDATADARSVLAAMSRFVRGVHAGRVRGASARKFTDVIHIGIGGSDLGPRLACEALAPYARAQPRLHFVSNVDGAALAAVTARLDPAATLVVIASKTFTTGETLANARSARAWLESRLRGKAARHLCAVTAAPARAAEFGVPAERVFRIWDWVGGRYSLWSAIGLPVALAAGMGRFDELRAGARAMDEHFAGAPPARNLPFALGLIEVWNATFRGAASRAVVPYDERLRLLPAYLQQLEMESCGKHVTRDGERVDYPTAPVTWGSAGTDGQHAYFQWLHQGTQAAPVEFIACCRPRHRLRAHHDLLIANCLAQAEALAFGTTGADAAALPPQRELEGNRPSTCILLDELTPRALGALLALYEHKVFVQSVIWDVNAFDQWGVELGKRLAGGILPELQAAGRASGHDSSTNGLINYLKARQRKKA